MKTTYTSYGGARVVNTREKKHHVTKKKPSVSIKVLERKEKKKQQKQLKKSEMVKKLEFLKHTEEDLIEVAVEEHKQFEEWNVMMHRCFNEIYYYGLVNDYYVLVMKYCNLSLVNFVKQYESNIKIIENLFFQCIELMREFHEHMVIHCDIKPDNIMISENKLYFIDFGLSQFYIEQDNIQSERNTQINGTPRYISPFIHQGLNYTPKDDIISLCYVFYELYKPLPWNSSGFVNDIQHEKNKEICLRWRVAIHHISKHLTTSTSNICLKVPQEEEKK